MEVQIRRVDPELPLPEYKTNGAAAMDLVVREGAVIPPHATVIFPLNVSLKLPRGHFALMAARSSLQKRGLMMANGIGILDEDYCGDSDEYLAAIYNRTDLPVTVERGERLTQLLILPYERAVLKEVQSLGAINRGGMGTTGI